MYRNGLLFAKKISGNLHLREAGVIGKQRITVFVYSSWLLIAGVILNLSGIAGPASTFIKLANLAQGLFVAIIYYAYYSRRISLTAAMGIFCIVLQVEISAETIYAALNNTYFDIALIIANMALSAVLLLLGIITYLRMVPYVVAILSLGTYAISYYITESEELASFFLVYFIVFIAFALLGSLMIRNIYQLDKENRQLKNESEEILDVFHLTKEEMNSYMQLAREKKLDPEKTADILISVGSTTEKRILDNVAHYMRQSTIEFDKLKERLPELTPSELEICSLILKEKKQKEIIELLGKSRSNITCQRTNIRAKLKLQPGENLLEVLKKRMEKPQEIS